MKRIVTLGVLTAIGAMSALAAPVTKERAATVAEAFMRTQPDAPASLTLKSIENIGTDLYLINFAPSGYVVMSADDNGEPVYGYSPTSNVSYSKMPDNMRHILDESAQTVRALKKVGRIDAGWQVIESGRLPMSRANEIVDPLIQVAWSQSTPYNQFCPGSGSTKALVGCVAVAMSQAMSVQRYPTKPNGQVKYYSGNYGNLSINFDQEEAYNWDAIISGANGFKEVARLLYHAGMAVNMDYGVTGSGVKTSELYRISDALVENFGYGKNVKYYERNDYRDDWVQLILNEVLAGRAVVYNAVDSKASSGHSFNVDGYRGTNGDFFHVNWGWGDSYNGYYKLSALSDPGQGMNYDANHVVIVGIGAADSALRSVDLSDLEVEEGLNPGTAVSAVLINGELADNSIYNVKVTGEAISSSSFASVPFEYKNGLLYTKETLTQSDKPIYVRIEVTVKGESGRMVQGFNLRVIGKQTLEHKTSVTYDRNEAMFNVHTKFGASYTLKNAAGTVVASGSLPNNPQFTFSRSLLTPGINTLEIVCDGQTKVLNIKL